MLEDIFHEPEAIEKTLLSIDRAVDAIIDKFTHDRARFIYLTGSGTSYHAGLASQYVFSTTARIPTTTIQASEFSRWTPSSFDEGTWLIAISQSGESADILTAAQEAAKKGAEVLGLTNTRDSSLAKIADETLLTEAGVEHAVTATKTYISQLAALYLFCLKLAKRNEVENVTPTLDRLYEMPEIVRGELTTLVTQVPEIARQFKDRNLYFLLGSGPNFATALEGALKLKESSNVYAEGFATREFLHGPQQLVNSKTPIISIIAQGEQESNMRLIERFRGFGAPIITVSSRSEAEGGLGVHQIVLDCEVPLTLTPMLYVIPLQLYAYHNSVLRGLDPDKPEKLTKVVK